MNLTNAALDAWKDRALAAEKRLDELLDRLTDPETALRLAPATKAAEAPALQERTYIPDTIDGDAAWREHKGIEGPEDEAPDPYESFELANEAAE